MKPTLYVHIGTHKTGTTSIQRFLRRNADKLREEGLYIPSSGTLDQDSGHHRLAWELRGDLRADRRGGQIEALLAELSGVSPQAAILSSEDFEYLSQHPAELKNFDARCEAIGFRTAYVAYHRNAADYLRSLYTELSSSHGLTEDFATFQERTGLNQSVTVRDGWFYDLDPARFGARWTNIVGPKLRQLSFDDAVADEGLLPSFLAQVGASGQLILLSRGAPVLNESKAKLIDRVTTLQNQIDDLHRSTSWRMTAPLRYAVDRVRALAGRSRS